MPHLTEEEVQEFYRRYKPKKNPMSMGKVIAIAILTVLLVFGLLAAWSIYQSTHGLPDDEIRKALDDTLILNYSRIPDPGQKAERDSLPKSGGSTIAYNNTGGWGTEFDYIGNAVVLWDEHADIHGGNWAYANGLVQVIGDTLVLLRQLFKERDSLIFANDHMKAALILQLDSIFDHYQKKAKKANVQSINQSGGVTAETINN